MEHKENNDQTINSSEKQGYQSSPIDLKFLKAADTIIEKNKKAKIRPRSDSAISKVLFGSRTVIGKIRARQRGITIMQLYKFANYFDLDFNYFFRDGESMFYKPQQTGRDQSVDITGKHIKNVDVISGTSGNVHKGNVHNYSGKVGKVIERVDNMAENTLNASQESVALEALSIEKEQEIQKIVRGYQERLRIVERERDQAKEKQAEISEKYIKLLEQKID